MEKVILGIIIGVMDGDRGIALIVRWVIRHQEMKKHVIVYGVRITTMRLLPNLIIVAIGMVKKIRIKDRVLFHKKKNIVIFSLYKSLKLKVK